MIAPKMCLARKIGQKFGACDGVVITSVNDCNSVIYG